MNVGTAYSLGASRLSRSSSPDLDARLLLEAATGLDHAQIVAFPEIELSLDQELIYFSSLKRATCGEPIPYITGRTSFDGLELMVSADVLIPRPETEILVHTASTWMVNSSIPESDFVVVDVGTGSGCIAIALATRFPQVTIVATDISEAALEIAKYNAQNLDAADQIRFVQGKLLEPVKIQPDLVIANLPYISDREWSSLDDSVKWYEPALALRGGVNGLEVIAELLTQAKLRLRNNAAIFLEIGWEQGADSIQLAKDFFPQAAIKVGRDYADRDRILSILI